jgi:hypothetical protein
LLHIFSLVLQPWMSAYIRKTDGGSLQVLWLYLSKFNNKIFSLVIQPWMSAYIRKTDGVYIFSPQKRLKHGRQNITLHRINGILQNNKCIFTKLNAVFILNTAAWTKNITTVNMSHNKATGLRNSFNNLNVNNM